jgi:GDP-L-fucose synthase
MAAAAPEIVFNCAANQGGVGYQERCPGEILFDNALIQLHVLDAASKAGVEHYVNVLPACVYPAHPGPDGLFHENEIDAGPMHPSADNYAITKRLAMQQARHYGRQYGLATTHVVLANTYGPRDHFDAERSHVLAALLVRFRDATHAEASSVVVWGSGSAERDLLFVRDAVTGIVLVAERQPATSPVNIGSGRGHSVREIATTVSGATGYRGEIVFDTGRPEGPLKKTLDISTLRALVNWAPPTTLVDGVRQTLAWLESSR